MKWCRYKSCSWSFRALKMLSHSDVPAQRIVSAFWFLFHCGNADVRFCWSWIILKCSSLMLVSRMSFVWTDSVPDWDNMKSKTYRPHLVGWLSLTHETDKIPLFFCLHLFKHEHRYQIKMTETKNRGFHLVCNHYVVWFMFIPSKTSSFTHYRFKTGHKGGSVYLLSCSPGTSL